MCRHAVRRPLGHIPQTSRPARAQAGVNKLDESARQLSAPADRLRKLLTAEDKKAMVRIAATATAQLHRSLWRADTGDGCRKRVGPGIHHPAGPEHPWRAGSRKRGGIKVPGEDQGCLHEVESSCLSSFLALVEHLRLVSHFFSDRLVQLVHAVRLSLILSTCRPC